MVKRIISGFVVALASIATAGAHRARRAVRR